MYVQPCILVPIYSTRGRFLRRTGSSPQCVWVKEVPTTYVINFSINSVYIYQFRLCCDVIREIILILYDIHLRIHNYNMCVL